MRCSFLFACADTAAQYSTARDEQELEDLAQSRFEIDFDPDVYRLLVSHIARHARSVRPLERHREAEAA